MSWRIFLPLLVFLLLTLGYIDKTVFHKQGVKSLEKTITTPGFKPTLTTKQQEAKEREKGYLWAEEHGITDEARCDGSSAFHLGCISYVQDTVNDARQDLDSLDQ